MRTESSALYLDLLKRMLINVIYKDPPIPMASEPPGPFDLKARLAGADRPSQAHTSIGMVGLDAIEQAFDAIRRDGVPGDLLEAGVGRGGATIFMRGLLRAYGITDRAVWVADSFTGLPRSAEDGVTRRSYTSPHWRQLAGLLQNDPEALNTMTELVYAGTAQDDVREHFDRYGLLDEQVRWLPGWFAHTLPAAPIERLALLRVDADLYDSTTTVLTTLAPKLAAGGFLMVDDHATLTECAQALRDYLTSDTARPDLIPVDGADLCWRRPA